MFATTKGMVKKTSMKAYDNVRRSGIIAINLRDDDELLDVRRVRPGEDVILVSTMGKAMRFHADDVRPTGRDTSGVRGMALKGDARVFAAEISNGNGDLFVITERGYGKRTPISEYAVHNRGGQGIFTIQMTEKKGLLAGCKVVGPQHELMIVSESGVIIRVKSNDVSRLGRSTQGVKVMNVADNDRVCAVARMVAAKPKAARKVDENQGTLDLAAAGAKEAPSEDDPIDIGGDEEMNEDMLD